MIIPKRHFVDYFEDGGGREDRDPGRFTAIVLQDDRGIEIPARRFTTMMDQATTRITALHKTGDGTIFRVVAGGLVGNVQSNDGDGYSVVWR